MYLILTYWQVYLALAASALAAWWAGWACCLLCYRPSRARHAARRARRPRAELEQLPAPLPPAPPLATAVLEARHANAMAATAPHDVTPLRRAATTAAALSRTIGMTAITAYVLDQWATKDRPGARPWAQATGSFPALIELEDTDPPPLELIP